MNTNELKRFAREARIKLLDQVGRKLEYVITADTAELRGMSNQINDLRTQINKIGKEQLIEKVAYTWFNRLMALRFMDANGYNTPMVVTPIVGYLMPQVLQEAKAGNVEEGLQLDLKRLNDLLDGKTQAADAQTEAYKLLLIASCNSLNSVMPFMFERISDYTELLLPDDLLSDYSIITDIRIGMTEEDCKQEELIGWLYQFYIADKKNEVFSDLKKNVKITAENIPAATQLFTPRWIVRYMVENTLGKLWLTLKPNSKLKEHMPYYIEAPEGNEPTPFPEGIKGVTDIKFLDPCQGSGHVLVYAFDLYTKIYEEEGYNTNEIPALILENNLFGIDIDERAAQLAAFALTMKGRSYYARFLRKPIKPNVIELVNIDFETIQQTIQLPIAVGEKIINEHDELTLFQLTQAKNFGSLIQIDPEELKILTIEKGSIWEAQQEKLHAEATYLAIKYHCVVTNPPYMGQKGMNPNLKKIVSENFKEGKTDLFSAFVFRLSNFTEDNGRIGLITPFVWMFISSFEEFRKKLLQVLSIDSLIQLEYNAFEPAVVPVCAYTLVKTNNLTIKATFINLSDFKGVSNQEPKTLEAISQQNCDWKFVKSKSDLKLIPSYIIAYWLSNEAILAFKQGKLLGSISEPRQGLATTENDRFLRRWYEIDIDNISFESKDSLTAIESEKKWFPYNKGGDYKRWYGNNSYIINYANNGEDLINLVRTKYPKISDPEFVIKNRKFYFKESITWSYISNAYFGVRYSSSGFIFDVAGSSIFPDKKDFGILLGLLSSKVASYYINAINPTMNIQAGSVAKIPVKYDELNLVKNEIEELVNEAIKIAKEDWDSQEISWHFRNPIQKQLAFNSVSDYVNHIIKKGEDCVIRLKIIEEKLNTIIIAIYKLSKTLNPEMPIKEITLVSNPYFKFKKVDNNDDDESLYDNLYLKDILLDLISYFVGCSFGRFRLTKPGLFISNKVKNLNEFLHDFEKSEVKPDEDNIIPFLEGEYFSDDIVGKYNLFVKSTFGDVSYVENLKLIEVNLGKDIRKYLVKDFYNDHIKRYKKRPIYWMFTSPKGHFKALIYMHRYRPDTISTMLNDYLRVYIGKLESEQQSLNQTSISESASARERTLATKRIAEIEVMLKDLKIYERTLFDYAAKKIEIDLDDGVKVNYLKFKEILLPIKGLDKDEE